MADFSLLTQPNFAQAALSGYQAGATQAKQQQVDSALQGIDLERPETLLPVLRADPSTGAALIGASTKLAAEKRDIASRAATAAYIKSIAPAVTGGASSTGSGNTPLPDVAATAASGTGAPSSMPEGSDVVVTGQRLPAADPNAIRNAAIDADPTGFLDIQKQIGAMDEAQRKRLDDASQSFASIGQGALALPYEQRRAYIAAHAGDLAAHGVPAAKIQSFDPTDQAIHTEIGQALGVKAQLDQADKDRTFAQTVHHQGVEEAQGAQRIGLEGQSVGIAAGHLAIARNADARAAKAATDKGSGAAGVIPSPTTRAAFNALPSGAMFKAPDGSIRRKP